VRVRGIPHSLAIAALVFTVAAVPAEAGSARVKARASAIDFTPNLDEALQRAAAEDKPIYLAFGAVWCPVCRNVKDGTLREPEIQDLADEFIWVWIDIDRRVTLAREWKVEATPTVFLLDSAGYPRRKIIGGADAEELAATLDGFLAALDTEFVTGEPMPAGVYRHTELVEAPRGFRAKSICFSNVGYGPLSVRSQSPFQSLRLGILPRTPSTLARGEQQLRLGSTWSNVWANDAGSFDPGNGELGPYLLDYESLDANLAYTYGLSDTFELEVEYEQRWRSGGVMDGFIEGFHDLFGLDQSGRDQWPRNQCRIVIDRGNDRPPLVLGEESCGTFARSVLVSLQNNLTCGGRKLPALSWAVTGRYFLGGTELEGNDFDIALSVAASHRFGRFYVYMTLGFAWFGSTSVYDLALNDTQFTVLAAGEWRFKPRMSLILQYLGSEGVAKDLGPFSSVSNEVIVGWKWELRPAGVLEIGLLENILSFDNSPDFGIHAAFTQRF